MKCVPKVDEAIGYLAAGIPADEIAQLYRLDPHALMTGTSGLRVVRAPVAPWRMVQVVESSDGSVEVVFELPDDDSVNVSELVAAYGEPDVERTFDGPAIFWFRPPAARGFLVGAYVRGDAAHDPVSRTVSVVAPARRPLNWKSPSFGRQRLGNVPPARTPGSAGATATDG